MTRFRKPSLTEQEVLDHLEIRLLGTNEPDVARFEELMVSHHYLKSNRLVGEQLRYVAEVNGRWVALLSWSAAAYHLKHREEWIGWEEPQRRRRLALVANNARFLILPGVDCPNLASRALALNAARLSRDWEAAYGRPDSGGGKLCGQPVVPRHLLQGSRLEFAGRDRRIWPLRAGFLHRA